MNLDIFYVKNALMVSGLCNLLLQKLSFFYIQILHNDCSHIEDVHLLFWAHLINISYFVFWGIVELIYFLCTSYFVHI